MSTRSGISVPSWTTALPVAAIVLLALGWGRALPDAVLVVVAITLVGAVLAAVHHAEVVAHRVGEPFGSLILAVAVTAIEVGLILTLMSSGGKDGATLARDTVYAAVMITTNGIVGLCLLVGSLKHFLAHFNAEGTGAALSTVITLSTVCLVLPTLTTTHPGLEFSPAQLVFAALASLGLYGLFVFTQTVRHRDFFLPVDRPETDADHDGHVDPPSDRTTLVSLGLLVVALVAVVGLAKIESPMIERVVAALGFPHTMVGVVIALVILLPEAIAAVRAAAADRVQTGMNLAYGSAMASIGLTIPVLAVFTLVKGQPLVLGLTSLQIALLGVTSVVSILTVAPGRAKPLQGGVHLALLAAFLVLSVQP